MSRFSKGDRVEYHASTIARLPEHDEPEDATDAYVEPEPLKEDQHVLVWAKVVRESDDSVYVSVGSEDLDWRQAWVGADAIVRPDAGSLPPWVKPARCTSLFMVNRIKLRQCGRPDDGHEMHSAGSVSWRDATAYGTVEISSLASPTPSSATTPNWSTSSPSLKATIALTAVVVGFLGFLALWGWAL